MSAFFSFFNNLSNSLLSYLKDEKLLTNPQFDRVSIIRPAVIERCSVAKDEYFFKKAEEKYKIPPKDYLTEKKIESAKKLLRESTANIMEISHSVGYSDQLYFSRLFKNKTGFSPTEYRKQFDSIFLH